MAGLANMATGISNTYRDQRRGPAQGNPRNSGRTNSYSRQAQSGSNNNMPKRNGSSNHPGSGQAQQMMQPGNSGEEQNKPNAYKNQRLVAGIMHMVGCRVRVEVPNGRIYDGILNTVSQEMDLELKEATVVSRGDGVPSSRDTVSSMIFRRGDFVQFTTSDVDLKGECFTDGAISRVNGQSLDCGEMKELEPWDAGSEAPDMTLESGASGSNGWDAHEMFSTNFKKFKVQSTYDESLQGYTTPMPKFKNDEERLKAEKFAADNAKLIESAEGYKQRAELENDPAVDEETKYSSVIRPPNNETEPASSSSGRYVPPNRRQQDHGPISPNQRATAPAPAMSQQPLPQRERRADRDRNQDNRGERDRGWERNPAARGAHASAVPSQPPPTAQVPSSQRPKDLAAERLNGESRDRRPEVTGRSGFQPRQPNHSIAQGPPSRFPSPQQHIQPHIVQSAPVQHAPSQMPASSPQVQGSRGNPSASVSSPPAVSAPPNTSSPLPSEKVESRTLSPHAQSSQGAPVVVPGVDKKSPEKGRQGNKIDRLIEFQMNFHLEEKKEGQQEEKEHEQSPPAEDAGITTPVQQTAASTSQGASTSPRGPPPASQGPSATTQGPSSVSQGSAAAAISAQGGSSQSAGAMAPLLGAAGGSDSSNANSSGSTSTLNPLAKEFEPRQMTPQLAVMQVTTPTPSGTPPQVLRQSPAPSMALMPMPNPYQSYTHIPVVNMQPHQSHQRVPTGATQQPQQQGGQRFPAKRVTVSVDTPQSASAMAMAAQAAQATGQPLTLAAQGSTMAQPGYLYQPLHGNVLPQGYPMQMRMMPHGASMDSSQAASNQQAHVQQPFLVAHQQPVPAHMQAQALTQTMPQPAHTVQQHHQHQHHHPLPSHQSHNALPPVSQTQAGNPHPSASPVQHMQPGAHAAAAPPQLNHSQGAPPTSNTPQPQLAFQHHHQISNLIPPQGATHAMPAHSVAQAPTHTPTIHFMQQHQHQHQHHQHQHHQQHQLPSGVNFSQAAGTANSGPAPAHLQHSGPMNQPQHVVVMPQPPPQAINQAPLNPPHTHHQHATAQFQQHIQSAANQMHGGVGHNQHLLQGNMPTAGAGLAMPQPVFAMQTGNSHSSHGHSHSHGPHPHYQGHAQ